jgi:hypothetical protein
MHKDIQDQFDAAFAANAKKVEAQQQAKVAKESQKDAFVRAFKELRTSSFRPALEEIAQYLQTNGMKTRIEELDEERAHSGRLEQHTAILIRLLIGDEERHYASHEQPYLQLICDQHAQLVQFHENTVAPGRGGHGGETGTANLDQVTHELIQQKVLAVVREVLK